MPEGKNGGGKNTRRNSQHDQCAQGDRRQIASAEVDHFGHRGGIDQRIHAGFAVPRGSVARKGRQDE